MGGSTWWPALPSYSSYTFLLYAFSHLAFPEGLNPEAYNEVDKSVRPAAGLAATASIALH